MWKDEQIQQKQASLLLVKPQTEGEGAFKKKKKKTHTLNFSFSESICTSRNNSFFLLFFAEVSVLAKTYV